MRTFVALLVPATFNVCSAQQWELVAPIKTRSGFPVTQIVYDLVGHTIDLQPDATDA